MMSKPKIILLMLAVGFIFLICACDDQPRVTKKSIPDEVTGKISRPVVPDKPPKDNKPIPESGPAVKDGEENASQVSELMSAIQKPDHYDAIGKRDPFKPLIQDKPEERKAVVDEGTKRILTPLEKIDISQIRLVAVIIMKNKRIAMVEEANGKGYEIGIGTYIGKNQGKVSEIKNSSIVIQELVKDYKGRVREQVQEIKLHKIDNEE